jgi:exopolysaccharide production protein ExoY
VNALISDTLLLPEQITPTGSSHNTRRWEAAAIRTLDMSVAVLALLFLAPVFLLVAVLVFVSDPGPVFFAHRRIGQGGRLFPCLKFRSMVIDSQERLDKLLASDPVKRAEWELNHKLKDDPRITAIGRFLRKSSLDELPQLLNVVRGDMSLVGPRPIVMAEAVRYGRYIKDYCSVRPGITGLWQISGRSDLSYRRRVALDTTYARAKSLGLDIKILLVTVPAVFAQRGSY